VLRIHQQWVRSDRTRVLAARSVLSVGVDLFNATENPGGLPDGRFVAWLAQLRWAERLEQLLGTELIVRADLQLSSQPLMPLEQFPIGGAASVRGYRENEIARDQGVAASVETRIPLLRTLSGHLLQLAPFLDVGHGWNESRPNFFPETLIGVGVGLRYGYRDRVRAEIYWGEPLKDLPAPSDRSIQDHGIHFRVSAELF